MTRRASGCQRKLRRIGYRGDRDSSRVFKCSPDDRCILSGDTLQSMLSDATELLPLSVAVVGCR